jgi:RNA polymerase sigma factor (sigma-70 family)
MGDSPVTRPSLLIRLRNADDGEAWSQFVEIYVPLIYGTARKQGLKEADAADLVQDVLRSVAGAIRKLEYDPRAGSFRGWLFTITRNRLNSLWVSRARKDAGLGGTTAQAKLNSQPAAEDQSQWNIEYRRRVFAWAAERVRKEVEESTWQAFHQTAVEGKSGKEVAAALGMSVAAVYLAKGRVMVRLKEAARQTDGDEIELV